MIRIRVVNAHQREEFEHPEGPLEFGRTTGGESQRFRIQDPYVSRDQLRIEEVAAGRIRIENLSQRTPIKLSGASSLAAGASLELAPPVDLFVGQTQIQVLPPGAGHVAGGLPGSWAERLDVSSLIAFSRPTTRPGAQGRAHAELKDGPAADALALWLDTVIALQQMAPDSPESYARVARAVVELIGLDLGLVMLRRPEGWRVVGSHTATDNLSVRFSRTLLDHVASQRRTFYQDLAAMKQRAASLDDLEAVVAAPVLGLQQEVVGVLYGSRCRGVVGRGGLASLEIRLVDLLAGVISANLVRAAALRTRVQLEEFFSVELVRQLERDASLLNGRTQEVTILCGDLRGFPVVAQRLEPDDSCRLLRDLRGCFTERILEQGGAIVDYAGDGIQALWNAPVAQPDHAARAARAAVEMLEELPALAERWGSALDGPLALGIGIHTGSAQVGNTGSTRKFKYGPHGHTVNLAVRVQEASRRLGLPLLITNATRKQLPAELATRRLGRFRLPHVHEPVLLHELQGESPPADWLARREVYENALLLFEAGRWPQACQALLALVPLGEAPATLDTPTHKLLQRAWDALGAAPGALDAVLDLTTG